MWLRLIRVRVLRFACLLCLIGGLTPALAQTQLRLGHVGIDQAPVGESAVAFVNNLARLSDDQLTVQRIGKGALGGLAQMWAQVRAGALDFHVIDIGAVSMLKEAGELRVMWTPFLFRDQVHYRKFIDSELFQDKAARIAESAGVRFIELIGERGARTIATTKKPIHRAEDLKGVRIRVPGSEIFIETFKRWGAVPTPIRASEIFTSLKSGVVEGQDNSIDSIANKWMGKVINYIAPVAWARSGIGLWISERTWDKLNAEQRQWVMQAAQETRVQGVLAAKRRLDRAMKSLPGYNIQLTDPDMASFTFVTEEIIEKFEGSLWPNGWVKTIQAIR